ncbi:GNAT family N-acetyltransferase [Acholeplasma laidlawii]|uniref:GNAT family N-acetyltransferase n=1 Tax=Acholeplasma laidlawii TaxID=2148 RepID=UPI0018C1EA01|nr:GNAT family N-acetyltransferase [Acholeplasma laidlawii]MBG0762237.1 GNAT family N-acetyltransferase [Acholeplasma laidlawii]
MIKPLNTETWDAYEKLIIKHHGVWGGCWCLSFHDKPKERERSYEANRIYKKSLVENNSTHAALVFHDEECIGWCQYGQPAELPNIYHKKEVEAKNPLPDYRITCIFVDRDYRNQGISSLALNGALDLIKQNGGGIVESYPQDTQGKTYTSSFLYNSTRQIFERAGFEYIDTKGKNHCIMRIKL